MSTKLTISLVGGGPVSTTGGFISFSRLVEQLRRAGEFREDEEVTHLVIVEHGIEYRVRAAPAPPAAGSEKG